MQDTVIKTWVYIRRVLSVICSLSNLEFVDNTVFINSIYSLMKFKQSDVVQTNLVIKDLIVVLLVIFHCGFWEVAADRKSVV